jgi:hypothetical protein
MHFHQHVSVCVVFIERQPRSSVTCFPSFHSVYNFNDYPFDINAFVAELADLDLAHTVVSAVCVCVFA